ncbi:MAG: peptide chain release factor 1 [Nanoarchaeota archaeon]|nr:peptide chain release factor 1 [Nanoarchaeota archaeon]
MKPEEKFKLKQTIKKLEQIRGKGTELISVYIPDGYSINLTTNQITYEKSTAVNIKSKQTRKNVLAALEKILVELRKYKQTPPNGMIIFCGNTGGERINLKIWVFSLPEPLKTKMYRCDQIFWLEPLKEIIQDKAEYLIVCADLQEAALGVLKGKHIQSLKKMESRVPGKFRAGGQSAARLARQRKEQKQSYMNELGRIITKAMEKHGTQKIILAGPGPFKEELNNERFLGQNLKKIIGLVDVGYAGTDGFEEVLQKSEDLIKEEELYNEKKELQEFFEKLAKTPNKTTYGYSQVLNIIETGAVEKIFITENNTEEKIEKINDIAKNYGTQIMIVSTETREGETLKALGGIGAILRYEIKT